MPTITIKDLPAAVHGALKSRALRHGRSLNREVVSCLQAAVSVEKVDVEELLASVDRARETDSAKLKPSLLKQALKNGRA